MEPLLLHSLSFYSDLVERLAGVPTNPDVVEIGSESGAMSELLARLAADRGGRLHVIEPYPSQLLRDLAAEHPNVHVIEGLSPQALADAPTAGLYVVDGDHNYATVTGEVAAIFDRPDAHDAIAVMHDVGWPAGRRDQYYAPDQLPAESVHEHSWDRGAVLDQAELGAVGHGFRGEGAFAFALLEGGPRNGVLTAIEDALTQRPDLALLTTPLVFGVGVIGRARTTAWDRVVELMRPYTDNPTLAAMERNRLALLLHVIEMQGAAMQRSPRDHLHLVSALTRAVKALS